jgi:hypothetical protein
MDTDTFGTHGNCRLSVEKHAHQTYKYVVNQKLKCFDDGIISANFSLKCSKFTHLNKNVTVTAAILDGWWDVTQDTNLKGDNPQIITTMFGWITLSPYSN